ncbi:MULTISPECIES: HAD hydrolase-like protein [Enterobacterales]|uniref:HAD hydrolase-like protein n=1 Tax=Enterobacterales TaxID=91347 RepID=UPI0021F41D8B|nr:HAD hydrolase-like protein [Hafnia alvei]MCV9377793.1 HAD hydrolase-like protein [Hafnia alvei]MDX6844285.1 HAD hydrolase-like protein [Hafnia alvei]
MFELCIFDLDNTLIHTDDLKEIRENLANNEDEDTLDDLLEALNEDDERIIYSQELIQEVIYRFPNILLAIFTRSPRSYTEAVLAWAYPEIEWDILICYEDVKPTKPSGKGIHDAMDKLGIDNLNQVIMIGDADIDIKAAYNAGCFAVLDQSGWPYRYAPEHWNALNLIPDAIINNPEKLLDVLDEPCQFLPSLECLLDSNLIASKRFDKVNHFIPKAIGGDATSFPIYSAGRNFSNYDSLRYKKQGHSLTVSIDDNKSSTEFPTEWINSLREFLCSECVDFFWETTTIITSVPHRPGRIPRLEHLLNQLMISLTDDPIEHCNVILVPDLLAYRDGVRSQHGEHLNHGDRFMNVRDHLVTSNVSKLALADKVLVIDDVVTTGASLIYASKFLKDAGAQKVILFALAKNISDVLR